MNNVLFYSESVMMTAVIKNSDMEVHMGMDTNLQYNIYWNLFQMS